MSKDKPIYLKIHDEIRQEIEQKKFKIGDRLPSERELAEKFQANRMTIRLAINLLVEEGIVEKRVGAGTFIANDKIQEKMKGMTSFTDIMLAQGKKPTSKTIAFFKTKPNILEKKNLQLTDNDEIIKMERIRYADELPICFEVASIPAKLIKGYSKKAITTSFYRTLAEHGLNIAGAKQHISAILATEQIAEFLQIKRGAAILMLQQVSFLKDKNKTPFEYVRSQYVGKRFEFYLEK